MLFALENFTDIFKFSSEPFNLKPPNERMSLCKLTKMGCGDMYVAIYSRWITHHFLSRSLYDFVLRIDQFPVFLSLMGGIGTSECTAILRHSLRSFTLLCQCISHMTVKSSSSYHLDFGFPLFLFPPGCHSIIILIVLWVPAYSPHEFSLSLSFSLSRFQSSSSSGFLLLS